MPVGIMQVLNDTSSPIDYHNRESDYKFTLKAKTQQQVTEGRIPSSDTRDDTLPWYDADHSEKHIEIKVGTVQLHLSERDSQFYINAVNGDAMNIGRLTNGGRYVVRFYVKTLNGSQELAVTIYNYDEKLKTGSGYVYASLLNDISANVASISMVKGVQL